MQRIVPNLWFDHNAAEAAEFYTSAFPGATSTVTARYPNEGLPGFQSDFAGAELTVDVEIDGYRLSFINAGPEFRPNPSVSFMLNFDRMLFGGDANVARERLDALWERLVDGGEVMMELAAYPYSPRYGWVQDRYGVSWQLILDEDGDEPRPFLMPSLMFGGDAQNRAREAVEYYTSLFEGSRIGTIAEYPEQAGPAPAGAIMFCDFQLEGQWFTAMDSAVPQDSSFTCGVSLEVSCPDQAEIDRLWSALSAVPEAEQCGWLADRFGLSWQIVPENMGELMRRPGAYARMLDMHKLVIADF
ncbi:MULTISPECIES: VOC family protein [unclassified Microbacterium]|uniref:VOC family protein n=1 Tax=unclassified Microbacterium TaxID=2609290 RepID=UPI00214ADD84|nr:MULTISPECIES: VOC family protein [unclassified Microbacterium]MCR2800453.1 VOC family protein [Microbacterium sp. zg.Y818]MCR2826340.1 VOC family protein [Microbacterium sp. zg.Y909]WIM22411.1 VOC family protein [Microbacterium sp. zg-Y818]